jgi:hypothetical protein
MKKLAQLFLLFSLSFCYSSVFAYVNNPAQNNDNSLDQSDTISGSNAHPDDPEMQPPSSDNPGFQPPGSDNVGLQPGPSDDVGLQPEN